MEKLWNGKKDCNGCGACQAICPCNAIEMEPDAEGFLYPRIDEKCCIDCGKCKDICEKNHCVTGQDGRYYAVRCEDENLLKASASGGAFSLLAEEILEQGGLICGAVFDEDFHVHHIMDTDITSMRKSKYVQSEMGDIYQRVQAALERKEKVLFTGTPCQCQGMQSYLRDNLDEDIMETCFFTAAIICRGVQSPGLWRDYVAYLSQEAPLEAYDFRDKRVLNDGHTVAYRVGGKEVAVNMNQDKFSRLYIKCLSLRPSCYNCDFCRTDLQADFTIGDFWGIEKVAPSLADGKGTSLVIARTEKAVAMMATMKEKAIVMECDREVCMQEALEKPAPEIILRKFLFKDFAQKDENGHCNIPLILKKFGV